MKRLLFCPCCKGDVEPEEVRKCVKCGRVICDLCAEGDIETSTVMCAKCKREDNQRIVTKFKVTCAERKVKRGIYKTG
jgi:hypothetical protein